MAFFKVWHGWGRSFQLSYTLCTEFLNACRGRARPYASMTARVTSSFHKIEYWASVLKMFKICCQCGENERNDDELPIGMWSKSDRMHGRNLVACFRLGVWKLRGVRRGAEKCPCVKKRTRHTYSLSVKKYENWTYFWRQIIAQRNDEPADKKRTGSFRILELIP
jgi:hypothetical protein